MVSKNNIFLETVVDLDFPKKSVRKYQLVKSPTPKKYNFNKKIDKGKKKYSQISFYIKILYPENDAIQLKHPLTKPVRLRYRALYFLPEAP